MDDIVEEKWIDKLLHLSGLKHIDTEQNNDNIIVIEALKGLCNLVFNSKVVQVICAKNEMVESITKRLLTYRYD